MEFSRKEKKIINQAITLHLQGNLKEAEKYYEELISKGCNDHRIFSNYGAILKDFGRLKEAELSTRRAIKLNPSYENAHSNLGIVLKSLGKLKEAELSPRRAIKLNPNHANSHCNLGSILKGLGKLKEAELSTRRAIKLNPNYAMAHSNLGSILKDLGKLKEAELSTRRAIKLNPNLAIAYFSLSTLNLSQESKLFRKQLFSPNILNNQLEKEKVYIYFARANFLHKESNFEESSKYLKLANNLKYKLHPSNIKNLKNETKELFIESNIDIETKKKHENFPESIFIVGMPRSGSTLIESIISRNSNVDDLGEINILKESFLNWKKIEKKLTFAEFYLNNLNIYKSKLKTMTNKYLYNYQYVGIICKLIPNVKIIHSYRNPLDNILSIYRTNFDKGNQYSSSLVDSAKVYLDQEEVMTRYKNRFRSKIYDLNYDSLVCKPDKEIKSLISWLGWQWEDQYLSPHLNQRYVQTASNVQVRSPINSKSIGGWKNYKKLLKPAMEIITLKDKYKSLKY